MPAFKVNCHLTNDTCQMLLVKSLLPNTTLQMALFKVQLSNAKFQMSLVKCQFSCANFKCHALNATLNYQLINANLWISNIKFKLSHAKRNAIIVCQILRIHMDSLKWSKHLVYCHCHVYVTLLLCDIFYMTIAKLQLSDGDCRMAIVKYYPMTKFDKWQF